MRTNFIKFRNKLLLHNMTTFKIYLSIIDAQSLLFRCKQTVNPKVGRNHGKILTCKNVTLFNRLYHNSNKITSFMCLPLVNDYWYPLIGLVLSFIIAFTYSRSRDYLERKYLEKYRTATNIKPAEVSDNDFYDCINTAMYFGKVYQQRVAADMNFITYNKKNEVSAICALKSVNAKLSEQDILILRTVSDSMVITSSLLENPCILNGTLGTISSPSRIQKQFGTV